MVRPHTKRYMENVKAHTGSGLIVTRDWVNNAKTRIFNMEMPPAVEKALQNRLRTLSIFTLVLTVLSMVAMIPIPRYFFTSLIIGATGALMDLAVEYKGVSRNEWNYPTRHLSFKKIPLELPVLFFSLGVLATFAHVVLTNPVTFSAFQPEDGIWGMSYVQLLLVATSLFFLWKYFRGQIKSLTFGALPLAIALYITYPEHWILAISIPPIYIDYYVERRMVQSAHITYDRYGEEVATHVAISYFPATMIILLLITMVLKRF
ncbi:MAG: hypothetical protein KAT70_00060 [Thermoplasmata archaeon]|nr:hypothetical protein [Thermoplasmata archaeon]